MPDWSAAQDRAEGAQRLAEGEQAARGAAEPTRENLARSTVGSSPDAGTVEQRLREALRAVEVQRMEYVEQADAIRERLAYGDL